MIDDKTPNKKLREIASELRFDVIELCYRSKSAHLASSLSCLDILVAAFWSGLEIDTLPSSSLKRDHLILSKGHAAMALYAVLAKRGVISREEMLSYNQDGGKLTEHPPVNTVPYIDAATGSLGHGLSIGAGIALSKKMQGIGSKVVVVLSDGENNEGSTWEAAMFASGKNLENLYVIIDANGWQATDRTKDVLNIDNLENKWAAFGWNAVSVDGHDPNALSAVLSENCTKQVPTAIVANTIKGKGISFMEDDNNWHYRVPTEKELEICKMELGIK